MARRSAGVQLILASASPRRVELLRALNVSHLCQPANIDESARQGELPAALAVRLAREKAAAVSGTYPDAVILAADTVVALGKTAFGKPNDARDARRMLRHISGRTHHVYTGVCVRHAEHISSIKVRTAVTVARLSPRWIDWYVASGEPFGKAGGYAIQGLASSMILAVRGSYTNVVGLPIPETLELLSRNTVALPWNNR